jgi:hypothetical protein
VHAVGSGRFAFAEHTAHAGESGAIGKARGSDSDGDARAAELAQSQAMAARIAIAAICLQRGVGGRVYEIQTRLNENEQNPSSREEVIPQSSPKKEPGQTDNSKPTAPKQQNRAYDVERNMRVLASEFIVLSGVIGERRNP